MNIPHPTLRGAVKHGVADKLGRPTLMLPHEESRLHQAMVDRTNSNMSLTKPMAGVIAAEILRLRGACFATDDGAPSAGWWRGFLKRHSNISLRSGSRLKASCLLAFTPETVNSFFDLYERLNSTYNFPDDCVLNGDESQIPTRSGEQILTIKACRRARAMDSDRHSHVTMLPFINAAGQLLPCVMFVFKGKVASREMIGYSLPDAAVLTTGTAHLVLSVCHLVCFAAETGWIRGASFLLCLMHLDRYLPPLDRRPVLLIMDQLHGHMTLEVMEFCRRRKIILLFLPSKMTWCFQPLDVGVFHSYHQACVKLLAVCQAQGYTINRNTIVPLYGATALRLAFRPEIITAAFRDAGLRPLNRRKYSASRRISHVFQVLFWSRTSSKALCIRANTNTNIGCRIPH